MERKPRITSICNEGPAYLVERSGMEVVAYDEQADYDPQRDKETRQEHTYADGEKARNAITSCSFHMQHLQQVRGQHGKS